MPPAAFRNQRAVLLPLIEFNTKNISPGWGFVLRRHYFDGKWWWVCHNQSLDNNTFLCNPTQQLLIYLAPSTVYGARFWFRSPERLAVANY